MSDEATGGGQLPKLDNNDHEQQVIEESILGSVMTERPTFTWADVVGYEEVVAMLKEAVVLPFKFPQLFTGGRMPPGVIWLFGHPGSGKTFLTKAAIHDLPEEVTIFDVSSFTTRLARTDRFVSTLFTLAREKKPSLIMIDEIDRFFGPAESPEAGCNAGNQEATSVASQFLCEMAKYQENKGVQVIGHTCKPWLLQAGIRRCADRDGFLSLPDSPTRGRLLKHMLTCRNKLAAEEDYQELGARLEGYTPSDIHCVVKDALMEPVREIQHATHFKTVSGQCDSDPGVTRDDLLAPCSPDDPGAVQLTWTEKMDSLYCRPVCKLDIERCIEKSKPSISEEEAEMGQLLL